MSVEDKEYRYVKHKLVTAESQWTWKETDNVGMEAKKVYKKWKMEEKKAWEKYEMEKNRTNAVKNAE